MIKKNLHIILDKKYTKYIVPNEYNIYLLKDNYLKTSEKKIYIYYVNEVSINSKEIFTLSQEIRELFEKLEQDYKKYENNFFTNVYLPLIEIIISIKNIIKKENIKNIFLYGGNDKIEFIPYYFAEGESQKKFLYFTPLYANYFIYKIFNQYYQIKILKKTSKIKIYYFKFVRRYLFLIFKFLYMFKFHYNLNRRNKELNYFFSKDKKNIIFPVRNIAQITSIEMLYKYLSTNAKFNPIFFAYERLMLTNNQVTRYLQRKNYNTLQIYKKNDIYYSIIKSFFKTLKKLICKKNFIWNNMNIRELTTELTLTDFEKNIYQYLLENKIKKYKKQINFIFSTEIQSPEAFIENGIAKKYGIRSCNVQAQSIRKIPLPTFYMNGDFLFENYQDYEFFTQFNYPNKNNMKFIGSFKYFFLLENNISNNNTNNNRKKIIFFTQPHEHENQIKILKKIINVLKGFQTLHIKKHPRDTKDYTYLIDNKKVFIEKQIDINIILNEYDIVISRTSTLLLDAILYRKIVLSILISNFDKNGKQVYINNKYLKVLSDLKDLDDFQKIISQYNIEEKILAIKKDLYNKRFLSHIENYLIDDYENKRRDCI